MNKTEISKFKIEIKHFDSLRLNDILEEVISKKEFPEELEEEVVKKLRNGNYIISETLGKIIILTKSEELYRLGIENRILGDWEYINLFGAGFKVDEIEEILEDLLFKIYQNDGDIRRRYIVDNMGKVGGERSLNLIEMLLDELTVTLPIENIRHSVSLGLNYEPEKIFDKFIDGIELQSKFEFVENLKIARIKIKNRLSEIDIGNKDNISTDNISFSEKLSLDETKIYENKSSFLYCYKEKKEMDYITHGCLKTITAFLNTEGGVLTIGVDDTGSVLGLKNDFSLLKNKQNQDGFRLKFDTILGNQIGDGNLAKYIDISFIDKGEEVIAKVKVNKSDEPVWLKTKNGDGFFVRRTGSTKEIRDHEMMKYIQNHWRQ